MKKSRFFTQDKTGYAFLLFLLIMLSDMFAVLTGFGGAVGLLFVLGSDMPMFSTYESSVISSCAVCGIFLTVLYAYRNNQSKKLRAIAAINIIMSLLTIMMNSIYYPFADMISHTIYRITGIEYFRTSALDHYMSLFVSVPMCIFCFVLLIKLKRGKEEGSDKASFRRTFCVTVTVFASVTAGSLAICNILPSEVYNRSGICYIAKQAEAVIDGDMHESRAEKIFDSITGETDYSQARETVKDNEAVSVFPAESGKVKMKKISYGTNYLSEKADESKGVFETFRIGDEKESVLKRMKKVSDITSVSVEYGENTVKEVYDFNAVNDISFLHLVEIIYFNASVVFENGILKDGNYTYTLETNAESDEIEVFEEEYRIGE